jgi:hypothetical protein
MKLSDQFQVLTALPPGNKADSHRIGGWVGPIVSVDFLEKRKSLTPVEIRIPDHPSRVLVTIICYPGSP